MNYKKLQDHMVNEHGVILVDSELREIVRSIAPELIEHFIEETNTKVHPMLLTDYLKYKI